MTTTRTTMNMTNGLPVVRVRTITGTEVSVKPESLEVLVEAVAAELDVDPDNITLTARGVDLDTSPDAFIDLVRRGALVSVGPRLQTGQLGRSRKIDSKKSVVELLQMLQESDGNPQLKVVVVDGGEGGSREMIVSADELLGFIGSEPKPKPEPQPEPKPEPEPVRTASEKRKREAAADPRGSTRRELQHAADLIRAKGIEMEQHKMENIRMTRRLEMLRAKATSRKLKRERRKAQRLGEAAASLSPLPPATTASDAAATIVTSARGTGFAGFKKGFLC